MAVVRQKERNCNGSSYVSTPTAASKPGAIFAAACSTLAAGNGSALAPAKIDFHILKDFFHGDCMVLVAGSANLDFVVRAPRIPAPGETVLGHDLQTFPGGKGANQAVACAQAGGARTEMVLALGRDAYAQPLKASLQKAGVVLHAQELDDVASGTAFICVSDDAENAITVAPGANARLLAAHLPPLAGYRFLLMQLEIPLGTVIDAARLARAAGLQVALNAAPAQALPQELLSLVDLLIVNEGELRAISQRRGSILEAMASLPCPTVVVTLGARGAVARQGGELHYQTGFAVQAVDTTGAGDTFCGVLIAQLAAGQAMPPALRFASAAAALCCTRPGAQSSVPATVEVGAFLAERGAPAPLAQQALERYCQAIA
jgi:ribokinase